MYLQEMVEMFNLGRCFNQELFTSLENGDYYWKDGKSRVRFTKKGSEAYVRYAEILRRGNEGRPEGLAGLLWAIEALPLFVSYSFGYCSKPIKAAQSMRKLLELV